MKVIYTFLLFILVSCTSTFPGYEEQESGLYFKLITIADSTKRINENDYIQFKYSFSDYTHSELSASRVLLKVNEVEEKGGLIEALTLINEKEIGEFIFPFSKLKFELDGAFLFQGLSDTTNIFAKLQIDSIYSQEGFESAQNKFLKWVSEVDTVDFDVLKENLLLDKFERDNNLVTKKTATGLRYITIKKGEGETASFGKRVELSYSGKFLNGREFNSTQRLENGVQEFYVGQELQVLKGIEEALLFMKEGDIVLLLLPSWIAFGEKGSSTGIVKEKTPVVYKVELTKLN